MNGGIQKLRILKRRLAVRSAIDEAPNYYLKTRQSFNLNFISTSVDIIFAPENSFWVQSVYVGVIGVSQAETDFAG